MEKLLLPQVSTQGRFNEKNCVSTTIAAWGEKIEEKLPKGWKILIRKQ